MLIRSDYHPARVQVRWTFQSDVCPIGLSFDQSSKLCKSLLFIPILIYKFLSTHNNTVQFCIIFNATCTPASCTTLCLPHAYLCQHPNNIKPSYLPQQFPVFHNNSTLAINNNNSPYSISKRFIRSCTHSRT
ncbi:hypothetical protein Hanom_Chr10g00891191 [Helianthus anomalus]